MGGKTCFIAQSGTYVKDDVTEVTIFPHHVEGLQHGGVVHLVEELQLEDGLLLFVARFHVGVADAALGFLEPVQRLRVGLYVCNKIFLFTCLGC